MPLGNGYAWVPKMLLHPGVLVTPSNTKATPMLTKTMDPTPKLVWWPKQLAIPLKPSLVDSPKQTSSRIHQVWRPKFDSTPSSLLPTQKPANRVIQQVWQPKKVPP